MFNTVTRVTNSSSVIQTFILTKTDGSMCLGYTGLHGELELEYLMIETRLIGESFECVMGECVI